MCGCAHSVRVCKVHLKDVKRHLEGVESSTEYAESVRCSLCVLSVIGMITCCSRKLTKMQHIKTQEHKIQKTLRQKFKSLSSSTEHNILTTVSYINEE